MLGVLEGAGARDGSQDWVSRRLDSEQPNIQVVLRWAADCRQPAGPLLRRIGDVWVWLLVRGNLRRDSELRQQIESLPAPALSSESDRMAWDWLQVHRLSPDRRHPQGGELLDK